MNIRWICSKIKINRKKEISFNHKTLKTEHKCEMRRTKIYKALPGPWRMNIRKWNKNEKALDTTQYIVKKKSSLPFQISKEGAISEDG